MWLRVMRFGFRFRPLHTTFIVATMAVGCQTSQHFQSDKEVEGVELTVELASARIQVVDHTVSKSPLPEVAIRLLVSTLDESELQRKLILRQSTDSLGTGVEMSLHSDEGELVVGAIQRWGMAPDSTVYYYLREFTQTDVLELHAQVRGTHVGEIYNLNGSEFMAEYDRDSPETQNVGDQFVRFYTAESTARKLTLNENWEGSMMISLVTDDAFSQWATQVTHDIRQSRVNAAKTACDADCICGIAGICGFFKCMPFAGGIANFMCVACGGTSLACSIAALF